MHVYNTCGIKLWCLEICTLLKPKLLSAQNVENQHTLPSTCFIFCTHFHHMFFYQRFFFVASNLSFSRHFVLSLAFSSRSTPIATHRLLIRSPLPMNSRKRLALICILQVSNLQVLLVILSLKSRFYSKKMWMWRVSEGSKCGRSHFEKIILRKSALKFSLCIEQFFL